MKITITQFIRSLYCVIFICITCISIGCKKKSKNENPDLPKLEFAINADSLGKSTFLLISDIHFDNSIARSKYNTTDTGNDLWKKFLLKFDSVLGMPDSPDFIIYTGDTPAHNCNRNKNQTDTVKSCSCEIETVLDSLRSVSKRHNKALFFLPGNNDALAGNYYPFRFNSYSTPFSLVDETNNPYPALNINQNSKVPPCIIERSDTADCYYSAYPVDGIRLLALNTVIFTDSLFNIAIKYKIDPFLLADKQMNWLANQLSEAKTKGEKVYIAMHVPPGIPLSKNGNSNQTSHGGNWTTKKNGKLNYSEKFAALINQYSDSCIEAVLFAHTHMEELFLFYDQQKVSEIAISNPGISPNHGNNPGFKIVTYNTNSKALLDYTTFYTRLDTVSNYWGTRTYTFSNTFNKISPNQSIFDHLSKMDFDTIKTRADKIYYVKR